LAKQTATAKAMLADVEAAVLAEVARVGLGAFNRKKVLQRFLDSGAKQSTLYRWVDSILASGQPEEQASRAIVAAAAARSALPDPAASVAASVASELPTIPKMEHIASQGAIPIIDRLNTCLSVAEQLMAHARTDDGKVRNSKLLLTASEHLRRCIDTAARITDTLMRAEKIERYHAAIMEEIGAESPETAERMLGRLSRLTATWGNS
jgi:hypothetical protein